MPERVKHLARVAVCAALAGSAVAADSQPVGDRFIAAYAQKYVRLYFAEEPEQLAQKTGANKSRGIAKYESLRRQVHLGNSKLGLSPQSQIIEALVLMELATAKHSLESLQHLDEARKVLEKCCANTAGAEGAAAHALLGHLYFKVPPDPLSFGDKQVSLAHFRQALSLDAEGAWPNYYYGVYFLDKKQPREALPYLAKAKVGLVPAGLAGIEAIVHGDAEKELKKLEGQATATP